MTKEQFSPTRRSVLRLGAMSAIGVGIGIPALSGSAAASYCPRTPGFWANHPEFWPLSNPYNVAGVYMGPEDLVKPTKGDKAQILAKHFLAARLNGENRSSGSSDCYNTPLGYDKYGLSPSDSVNDVKNYARYWLQASADAGYWGTKKQTDWYIDADIPVKNGEVLKNILDAFNNDPSKLGLTCKCDQDYK